MKRLKISYKNRNLGHSTIKLNNNENTLVYKFSVDGGTSSIFSVNNLFFFGDQNRVVAYLTHSTKNLINHQKSRYD